MGSWKRVNSCELCSGSRCVISVNNERMAYCFRYGKTFFLSNDYQYNINVKNKERGLRKKGKQKTFDFGSTHIEAIET